MSFSAKFWELKDELRYISWSAGIYKLQSNMQTTNYNVI